MSEDDHLYDDLHDEHEFGCLFPDECLMPHPYHFPSECHTVEMMEEYYEEEQA